MSRSRMLRSALAVLFALLLAGPASVVAQGTPESGAEGAQTLLQQTLTTGELPEGEIFIGFFYVSTDPGYEENITGEEAVGPALLYMISGELTAQSEATLQVTRAGTETPEEVAPNTPAVLSAGDAIYFQRNAPRRALNAGAEPAVYLVGLIIPPGPPPPPREGINSMPMGFIGVDETSQIPPGSSITVTMEHITIAAGSQHELGPGPAIVSIVSGGVALTPDGHLTYTKGAGEGVTPGPMMERPDAIVATPGAETALAGTDGAVLGTGTNVTISNMEDRPAVLLAMSIAPAEGGSATPVT